MKLYSGHEPGSGHDFEIDESARLDHPLVRRGHFTRPDVVTQPLYVVTMISNPVRYRKRWDLYEKFIRHVHDAGAIPITVEVAFGNRAFAITHPDNPFHVQLRTPDELWIKENALNVG